MCFLYDRQGNPLVHEIDESGRKRYKMTGSTDSWFIGFAPADNPQIAFAVMVENGGQGAKSAAPIAARIVGKAASLNYLKSRDAAPTARSNAVDRRRELRHSIGVESRSALMAECVETHARR